MSSSHSATVPIELKVPNQKTINAFDEKDIESVSLQELRDM